MKKIKLLTPILGLTGIAGAIMPLVGCSCTKSEATHIVAAQKDVNISGNGVYGYLLFTLEEEIGDDVLTTDLTEYGTENFFFEEALVKGRLVSIPVIWKNKDITATTVDTLDIAFICNDKNGNQKWIQIIRDCTLTYNPKITFLDQKAGRKILTTNVTGNKMTAEFKFKLTKEIKDEKLSLVPTIEPLDTDLKFYDSSLTIDETDKTLVTLKVTALRDGVANLAVGDEFQFSVQFRCVYDDKYTYWESHKFDYCSMSYDITEELITEEDFLLEENKSGGYTLVGFRPQTSEIVNTLSIPKTTSDGKKITAIGDGTNPLDISTNFKISKIKFEDSYIPTISKNCFSGNKNIKFIDLGNIDNTIESIESISFGDNSFDLDLTSSKTGRIVWNSSLSKYNQHILQSKFLRAGLASPSWYGATEVKNLTELKRCAVSGENIKLIDDIEIPESSNYTGQINFYISSIVDLNGHKITCKSPIYNTKMGEYAVIGIYDCEMIFTDTSTKHNGSIEAFDQSDIVKETAYPESGVSTNFWEWNSYTSEWKPRLTNCFYCSADIASESKGSLEITAGKYYGNSSVVYNFNTSCYIEHLYRKDDEKTLDTYQGTYAPEFHVLAPYFEVSSTQIIPPITYKEAALATLMCNDSSYKYLDSYFLTAGGKFFAKDSSETTTEQTVRHYFEPSRSTINKDTDGNPANWLKLGDDYIAYDSVKIQDTEADEYYNLVRPLDLEE